PTPTRVSLPLPPPSGHPREQESGSAYTIKKPAASLRSHLVPILRGSLLPSLLLGAALPPEKCCCPL
ncbi:unnamed protein product, partial [Staurois parvus]